MSDEQQRNVWDEHDDFGRYDAAYWRQRFRDAMPPMSDEDWELLCERMAARMRGEPHVHTRLCACGDEEGDDGGS